MTLATFCLQADFGEAGEFISGQGHPTLVCPVLLGKGVPGCTNPQRICISRKQSLTPGLGALALAEEHNKEEGHHKGLQLCRKASENISGLVFLPAVYFSWDTGQAHPARAAEWLGKLEHKFTDSCPVPPLMVWSAAMASATSLQLHRETH